MAASERLQKFFWPRIPPQWPGGQRAFDDTIPNIALVGSVFWDSNSLAEAESGYGNSERARACAEVCYVCLCVCTCVNVSNLRFVCVHMCIHVHVRACASVRVILRK